MEDYSSDRRRASRGPCASGSHSQTVPGHPQCVSHPGDGVGQRLSEVDRSRTVHGGTVLPRTASLRGGRLLQRVQ